MSDTPPQVPTGGAEAGEFGLLAEAAVELGLDPARVPPVTRRSVCLPNDAATGMQQVNLLAWGDGEPELVLLHGGGQNAHTWDLVLLLLNRPAAAIDLPGHGHSDWRADRDYGPLCNADAVAAVIAQHAPRAQAVVGMSLGGMTLIHLAATHPDLVRRAVLVDVTPGSGGAAAALSAQQRGAVQLTRGPRTFATRQQMVDAAVAASPRRPASAVRRGVIHNSRRLPDGTWAWRYDRSDPDLPSPAAQLWADVSRLSMPVLLVVGGESGFTTDTDRAEMSRRLPGLRTATVPGAGHAVQSDQPAALAELISRFAPPAAAR